MPGQNILASLGLLDAVCCLGDLTEWRAACRLPGIVKNVSWLEAPPLPQTGWERDLFSLADSEGF